MLDPLSIAAPFKTLLTEEGAVDRLYEIALKGGGETLDAFKKERAFSLETFQTTLNLFFQQAYFPRFLRGEEKRETALLMIEKAAAFFDLEPPLYIIKILSHFPKEFFKDWDSEEVLRRFLNRGNLNRIDFYYFTLVRNKLSEVSQDTKYDIIEALPNKLTPPWDSPETLNELLERLSWIGDLSPIFQGRVFEYFLGELLSLKPLETMAEVKHLSEFVEVLFSELCVRESFGFSLYVFELALCDWFSVEGEKPLFKHRGYVRVPNWAEVLSVTLETESVRDVLSGLYKLSFHFDAPSLLEETLKTLVLRQTLTLEMAFEALAVYKELLPDSERCYKRAKMVLQGYAARMTVEEILKLQKRTTTRLDRCVLLKRMEARFFDVLNQLYHETSEKYRNTFEEGVEKASKKSILLENGRFIMLTAGITYDE